MDISVQELKISPATGKVHWPIKSFLTSLLYDKLAYGFNIIEGDVI